MRIKPMAIVLGLTGQAIIALAFFYLIPEGFLESDVRILNFIIASIIYWLWGGNLCIAPVDMDDPSRRQVSSLGIKWWAICWYTFFAGVFMIVNICMAGSEHPPLSFSVQLIVQCAFLFLFAVAAYTSSQTAEHAHDVYLAEQRTKSGKEGIKQALDALTEAAFSSSDVPADIRRRLEALAVDTRYISPSGSSAAIEADRSVIADCNSLRPAFLDYEMNKEEILKGMTRLERHFKRRRQIM